MENNIKSNGGHERSTSKILLFLLSRTGELAVGSLVALYDIRRWGWAYVKDGGASIREIKQLQNKSRVREAYRSLKRYNYLIERKVGRRLIITLSDKGKTALIKQQLLQADYLPKGTFTVIIFDIPESERLSRRQFRLLLRQSGFIKLQQSVWVSRRDVRQAVAEFIHRLKLSKWVNVYYGSNFFKVPYFN
ncbi:MAG: CRISPR-associated endonuclease Cas2 [Candidatus Veblenbacteria bacterium RIFOXYA2_FULL_43_9]|uniref:CRISPR-associated endonuclease Cas2 n=1 Tax=Candidatus Veblenbacteria bacterium RIFOXYA2_FULL_43_9 TaxID=1802425 RepID=A0A1G2Q2S7_9BACT|nr:MAG: CRISPR-associated endonuclease Cas2 [Candidatus Veblenbacteria bacterium RIFOXYA2_FULL_43_9]